MAGGVSGKGTMGWKVGVWLWLAVVAVGAVAGEPDPQPRQDGSNSHPRWKECTAATARRLGTERGRGWTVMGVTWLGSAGVLGMSAAVLLCVVEAESRRLAAVEEAALQLMDAVLRALLPDRLAEHLGCGLDNLPDRPPPPNLALLAEANASQLADTNYTNAPADGDPSKAV